MHENQSGQPPPSNDLTTRARRIASDLSDFDLFVTILKRQLASVTQTSETAAHDILSSLKDVDTRIMGLLQTIRQSVATDGTGAIVAGMEAQLRKGVGSIESFEERQSVSGDELQDQRRRIAGETNAVLGVVAGIDEITRTTTILSFNVGIEAARAGEAGRGFAIIAEEIRKLSTQTQMLSKEIVARVKSLERAILHDLRLLEDQREQAIRHDLAIVGHVLNGLDTSLSDLLAQQQNTLGKVERESEAIATPVMTMMASIQFQDIIRQQLAQLGDTSKAVQDHVEALRSALIEPTAPMPDATLSERIDAQFAHYVMHGQRADHHAAQEKDAAGDRSSMIELF